MGVYDHSRACKRLAKSPFSHITPARGLIICHKTAHGALHLPAPAGSSEISAALAFPCGMRRLLQAVSGSARCESTSRASALSRILLKVRASKP